MLFNSVQFAIFFVIVYTLYLVLNHKGQNRMLLVASCVFYGAWDWRFLFLIFISIGVDFYCAKYIYQLSDNKARRWFLILNIIVNIGILGFFKYFNFFQENLSTLLRLFGFSVNPHLLHVILPIGISFYTFQALSYSFDVYNRRLVPTKNFLDFALFVIYFPQLVAGPIERASHLLPQILKPREVTLDKFYEGSYLIFWGLFEKIFVADNLAKIVDPLFASQPPYNGVNVLLLAYAFAFQIYCDFDGYSNIARGLGKCMGFDIMVNFNLPYFATNPREFWKRWHISLSTWLRDYLYIPLGGNREGLVNTYRNLAITMLLGGIWHGAAWTFVFWGAYQGILLIIHRRMQPWLERIPPFRNLVLEKIWFMVRVIFFFHLVCIGWIIFRANSMTQVYDMLYGLFFNFRFTFNIGIRANFQNLIAFVYVFGAVQVVMFMKKDLMVIYRSRVALKVCFYILCFYMMVLGGSSGGKEFIYFQF